MDFKLRKWEKSDAENFFKYSISPEVTEDMRASFPSTSEGSRKIVENFSCSDETAKTTFIVRMQKLHTGSAAPSGARVL